MWIIMDACTWHYSTVKWLQSTIGTWERSFPLVRLLVCGNVSRTGSALWWGGYQHRSGINQAISHNGRLWKVKGAILLISSNKKGSLEFWLVQLWNALLVPFPCTMSNLKEQLLWKNQHINVNTDNKRIWDYTEPPRCLTWRVFLNSPDK